MPPTFRHAMAAVSLTVALTLATSTATITFASASARPAAPATMSWDSWAATTSGLPPHSIWIDEVATVTDRASAYLATRLPDSTIEPAVVLDIDNTTLETTYAGGITIPAILPSLALAEQAHDSGAAVIFVTARPAILRQITVHNLEEAGYAVDDLHMRGILDFSDKQTLKTNARIQIEEAGYTIVANIGNNDSDVAGGHAERTFKLPDYHGQLS